MTGLVLLAGLSVAQAADVAIVESGPFKVKDKRAYHTLLVLGPRFVPPGIGGRLMHTLDDHLTVMVGGGYSGWDILGLQLKHVDARAGLDYEPIGNGLDGAYLGPRVVYRSFLGSVSKDGQASGYSSQAMSFGGVVGWRWVWNPGFSLGGGFGAAYTTWIAEAGTLDQGNPLKVVGLAPMAEMTLGFAF